uniref:Uncharacterized protein n=1 Tax=Sphaerodactylus townsendi TaxID=933632 RepID=A0ACB8EG04_9SAUR
MFFTNALQIQTFPSGSLFCFPVLCQTSRFLTNFFPSGSCFWGLCLIEHIWGSFENFNLSISSNVLNTSQEYLYLRLGTQKMKIWHADICPLAYVQHLFKIVFPIFAVLSGVKFYFLWSASHEASCAMLYLYFLHNSMNFSSTIADIQEL